MTYLNLLWHFHQPLYFEPFAPELKTSVITFRTLYNYFPMAVFLERYPEVKVTCNLTPTLVRQIKGIADREINDVFLNFLVSPPSESDKDLIAFFWKEIPSAVKSKYKRPAMLFEKIKTGSANEKEISDMKVWLHIFCFHPVVLENEKEISELIYKGLYFTDDDKALMAGKEQEIFDSVLKKYKNLQESSQIEISTTPYYHPILPLVCDIRCSRHTETGLSVPEINFSYPEDCNVHIRKAKSFYRDIFGKEVSGMWPAEGGLSDETLDIFAENGLKWVASDEYLLLKATGRADFGKIHSWKGSLAVFFRNRWFSDLVGFSYQKWEEKDAARDLTAKIAGFSPQTKTVLPVILDGENPWEWYRQQGSVFIPAFYEALSGNKNISMLTFSESLDTGIEKENFSVFLPGTWMGQHFDNWIGQPVANQGWQILAAARDAWDREKQTGKTFPGDPYELLLFAESSDFFWWMSLSADPGVKKKFHNLFISVLKKFYETLGMTPPSEIESLTAGQPDDVVRSVPRKIIEPVIDGKKTDFFKWTGSAEISPEKLWSTYQPVNLPVSKIFYGCGRTDFFMRLDFKERFSGRVRIEFEGKEPVVFEVSPDAPLLPGTAYEDVFEWKIPLADIGSGDEISFRIFLIHPDGKTFYQFPPEGLFTFRRNHIDFDWQA